MEITFLQLVLGLILMIVPCYIMYKFNIKLLNKTVKAWGKMLVYLLVLGICLYYVILWNKPVFTLLFGLLMIVAGTVLTTSRAKLKFRQMFIPVLTGSLVGVLVVGFYFLFLVMGLKNPLEARFFVPVIGLLIGHLVMVNSQALHIYYIGLCHHGQLYHYLLSNGASQHTAMNYLTRRAIERSAMPSISNMGWIVVGLSPVILWGMMLGGVSALTAVAYQALLLIAMLCASLVSIVVTLTVSRKYLLDDYSQLKRIKEHEETE